MAIYLLKSTAILAIFWVLYVLFLEKENMHRFKRFYLLTSIIAAFCIPLLSITQYVYVEPDGFQFSNEAIPFIIDDAIPIIDTPFWTLDRMLLAIYLLGVGIFSIRFFKNIFKMVKTINVNEKQKQSSITFVLLKQLVNPHTFFNFIFLNKTKFQKKEVPQEVILHEETHAKQKHSLDILFIELLQIVFWFQPFIWLYKKRIKLNHEFLADRAVIDNGFQQASYQNTLLSYSSHQDYSLCNAINYSSIKKRFTVMKTQTSKQKKWALRLLVLPLLGLLFYSFSNREIVEVQLEKPNRSETSSQQNPPTTKEIAEYNTWAQNVRSKFVNISDDTIWMPPIEEKDLVKNLRIYRRMTKKQREVSEENPYPNLDADDIEKSISASQKTKPTPKEISEYNTWAKKMKAKFKTMPESEKVNGYPHMINDETFRYHNSIYDRMSQTQKDNAESLPEAVLVTEWPMPTVVIVDEVSNQQKLPTVKEVAEYNSWAKKMSSQINKAKSNKNVDYPIIKQKDILRYKSIYNRMTAKQKDNAEAFPNIPPPPPPPPIKVKQYKNEKKTTLEYIIKNTRKGAKSGYEVLDNGESHYYIFYKGKKTYYNKDGYVTDDKGNVLPPPPPPPIPQGKVTDSQMKAYNKWVKDIKNEDVVYNNIKKEDYKYFMSIYNRMTDSQKKSSAGLPPPPPPPPAPHVPKKDKNRGGPNSTHNTADYVKNDCLEIPATFSTKGNNTLNIKCIENYSNNKFQVYNRWGNLIYSKENYDNSWDGNVKESNAQKGTVKPVSGTYYYVFESPKLEEPKVGYLSINQNNDEVKPKKAYQKDALNTKNFEINLNKKGENIVLKCKKGCEWDILEFDLPYNTPKIVNQYGLNKIDARTSSGTFYFILSQDEGTFDLKSTKNSTWNGFSSSSKEEISITLLNDDIKKSTK